MGTTIHKLISIHGIGKFRRYDVLKPGWNGIFSNCNAIYADNGSGKTTFTQILKSLSKEYDIQVLQKRKSFDYDEDVSVDILALTNSGSPRALRYNGRKWNQYPCNIIAFDSYFVEDNVYVIDLEDAGAVKEEINILLGVPEVNCWRRLEELKRERKRQSNYRQRLSREIKRNPENKIDFEREKILSKQRSGEITEEINKLEKEILKVSNNSNIYINRINEYLSRICPDLKLTNLNKKRNNLFVYNLEIKGHVVRNDGEGISLKHTLSEGEKNALALSFFLANLSIDRNLSDKIIIFDDPISSLDSNRRLFTLNELTRISRKCAQFFLLSHDMLFVRDFLYKRDDALTLRIFNNGSTSYFVEFDVDKATRTGIFKDLSTIQEFILNPNISDYDMRNVARCIRPILEGFFRIKYYGRWKDGEWLGDFLKAIRNADEADELHVQKQNLDDLEDLNDYSKRYHHSNPSYMEENINADELLSMCKLTIKSLHKL